MKDAFAYFQAASHDCVEYGNRELDSVSNGWPRLIVPDASTRIISLSRGALGLYTTENNTTRPGTAFLRPGSLLWNNAPSPTSESKLQIWDGDDWRSVPTGLGTPIAADRTFQSGSISTTNLAVAPGVGLYLLEWYLMCTAGGTGGNQVTLTV